MAYDKDFFANPIRFLSVRIHRDRTIDPAMRAHLNAAIGEHKKAHISFGDRAAVATALFAYWQTLRLQGVMATTPCDDPKYLGIAKSHSIMAAIVRQALGVAKPASKRGSRGMKPPTSPPPKADDVSPT